MSKILKLHHPTGHLYWQKDEYEIELPNGKFINPLEHIKDNCGGYRVYWDNTGVWVQICASGSGYGKVDRTDIPPKLLVSSSEYDKIEFAGNPIEVSEELRNKFLANGWR